MTETHTKTLSLGVHANCHLPFLCKALYPDPPQLLLKQCNSDPTGMAAPTMLQLDLLLGTWASLQSEEWPTYPCLPEGGHLPCTCLVTLKKVTRDEKRARQCIP